MNLVQQLQSDLNIAEKQKQQNFNELQNVQNKHREELQHVEDLYMGRLRAKDLEIESLEENIRDKEAVANDKIA